MSLILWADDDGALGLQALQWALETHGCTLNHARDFQKARALLDLSLTNGMSRYTGAMVDVLLSHAAQGPTFVSDLGVECAEHMAKAGIPRIAFVTVVPHEDFKKRFDWLAEQYPRSLWEYFDKLKLLEPGELTRLCGHLNIQRLEHRSAGEGGGC